MAALYWTFPRIDPTPLVTLREKYSSLIKAVVGELKVKEVLLSPTTKKLLIRLDNSHSRTDLESLQPTKEQLLALNDGTEVRGVIVSLKGDLHRGREDSRGLHKHHFASRYFAPWVGIDEDPVTGSAHTVLAPYWSNQLGLEELKCRQCSPRGGELSLKVREDGRVDIFGKGTTVVEGKINV